MRAAAARALGQIRGPDARAALTAARDDEHPKVRRAVAAALGEFRGDPAAGDVLARWLQAGDPSYFVEAAVALALGASRSPEALGLLPTLLDRPSFQDVIRARALEGLGATGDERALPVLEARLRAPGARSRRGGRPCRAWPASPRARRWARRARELLERGLDDEDFRVRVEAAAGLVTLSDAKAIPAMERAMRAELDGRVKRRLREAIRDIAEKGRPAEQARKLAEEVERLRNELGEMRGRLERVESTSSGAEALGGETGSTTAAAIPPGQQAPAPEDPLKRRDDRSATRLSRNRSRCSRQDRCRVVGFARFARGPTSPDRGRRAVQRVRPSPSRGTGCRRRRRHSA